MLGGKAQAHAAGNQDAQLRASGHQIGDERGRCQEVLEVVEDQQPSTLSNSLTHDVEWRTFRVIASSDGPGDRARDESGIADGGQGNERHPLTLLGQRVRCRQGEARLAHSAGTGQGNEPGRG
jgi:hypothetical protein